MNKPSFKNRKPISLQLDFLEQEQPKKEPIPEIDFEEFCNNIPEHAAQELNFSKVESSESPNEEPDNHVTTINEGSQVEYMVFEEFNPQVTSQSESVRNSCQIDSMIKEPPAPCNKQQTRFSFPTSSGQQCTKQVQLVKKQLQIAIPEADNTSMSSYEQTMIKQQQQLQQASEGSQQSSVVQLQKELEMMRLQFKQELADIIQKKSLIEKKLEQEEENNKKLQLENAQMQEKLNNYLDGRSECLSHSLPHKLNDNDKISYLIDKLHKKSNQNARLQYEILKLQNHIEILQTKHMMSQQNHHDSEHLSDNQSPQQFQSLRHQLNLSAYQAQLDQKKTVNLSSLVSPLAKSNKASYPKNMTTHTNKNYKEDQNIKKIQSTKNSTSVGDLNTFKHDLANYSNILQKIMRKDSHSSPDKNLYATQKFRDTLSTKIQNIPDKHKSYASLLFSLGDFNKTKFQDAYIRQHSPHIPVDTKSQAYHAHPNSRKQSETIKSEESHKISTEQPKYWDKHIDNVQHQRKDILQLMKDIKLQKIGCKNIYNVVQTKINYKKPHNRQQSIQLYKSVLRMQEQPIQQIKF